MPSILLVIGFTYHLGFYVNFEIGIDIAPPVLGKQMERTVHPSRLKPMLLAFVLFLVGTSMGPALASEVNAIPILPTENGGLYIPAMIDSRIESELLIDTGSSYVVLTATTFERVSEQTKSNFSRFIYGAMANGKVERVSLFWLGTLQLSENCILRNIEVAILPNADKDILGLNALTLLAPFSISLSPAVLSSQSCST